MTEECGLYKDSTYRILKGLRKNNLSHGPDNRDCTLKVPSKRNTAVLPKYPELNIKRDGTLHKKIKEFEVLLLEYEEEECDIDDDDDDDDDDDAAAAAIDATVAAADEDAEKSEDENERYNDGDGDAAMVYEENECNNEAERRDAEWKHKIEYKNDDEDSNGMLEADGKKEMEDDKIADDIDTTEEEKENDEDGRGDVSIALKRGGNEFDGEIDTLFIQGCEEEKDHRERDPISAVDESVGSKQNFKGNHDTVVHESGDDKDNGNGGGGSIAPVEAPGSNMVRVRNYEADHTTNESNGDLVAFEEGNNEVKRNKFNKNTDSDTNTKVPQSDVGGGNNVSLEPETKMVKKLEKKSQNGVDVGINDDDNDSDLSQSDAHVAEFGDSLNGFLTDDTLDQYSNIQTDTEIESDDDIEESDGPIPCSPEDEDINGQTQTRSVKKKDMDDQEDDNSMSGIFGIYANSQYDVDFVFHK